MNNNLSAGPTLEDIEETTSEAETNNDSTTTEPSDTPTDADQFTWHCPYCDYTHTELSNVRDHITETVEGDHEGISGWSPTEDIIASNPDGDTVRRIEGAGERPDEDHHLDHGEKKTLIINAWLELDKERDLDAITAVIPVSDEYARRITKQLADGEITPEEYRTHLDWDIRNELGERLEQYYETQPDTTDTTTTQMSLTETDDVERGTKKKQIINAYLLDPEISPSDLDDILSSSYEYIRREVKKLKDGEIDQDEIEAAADEHLQEQIREELENIGVDVEDTESTTTAESTVDSDTDQSQLMDDLEEYSKKERILNSVLLSRELDEDIHYTDIADAAHCSDEYARRTTKEIHEGDITDDELADAADDDLQTLLRNYYTQTGVLASESASETATTESVDIDLTSDEPFAATDLSKRDALANIYLFDDDIHYTDAAKLAGCSDEYARQTFNKFTDGEADPSDAQNDAVQAALADLRESGALAEFLEKEDQEEEVEEPEREPEPEGKPETAETPTETLEATVSNATGTIPASELEELRETANLLYRQARYEGDGTDKKAEFIAKELHDRIDDLLEQHT